MVDGHDLNTWLDEQIKKIPILDVHTHLDSAHMSARGLHDVLLYHMVVSDLYSAGCPSGHRVAEGEEGARLQEAIPYLRYIQNTSCFYGVRLILRDLYGFTGEITLDNYGELDERIKQVSNDPNWSRRILEKANVKKAMTEWALRRDGDFDDCLEYSFEETAFCRVSQYEPLDAPLAELERVSQSRIQDLVDVKEAFARFATLIPYGEVRSYANHLSTDIVYRPISDADMEAALKKRSTATLTQEDRDTFSNYLLTLLLAELEQHHAEIVFQFSLGAEPLPYETGSKLKQDTIFQLVDILNRFPKLQFNCMLSSTHASQSLCTVARECPNLSFSGYWWHSFFPKSIRNIMEERLDMLALNKQVGFFSDAYCAEWVYAKSVIVRKELVRVLAQRIQQGQYTPDTALAIAREILWETPQSLLGMLK